MTERFIKITEIINRVHLLGGDLVDEVTEDDILTYALELIGIVNMPALYLKKEADLKIHKYKAALPCDFIEVRGVKCCDAKFNPSTDLYDVAHSRTDNPTYRIQGSYIITSIEEGYIKMSYTAIKTDEEGYPMLVDDQSFIRALVSYIVYKKAYTQFINGRLPSAAILEKLEQDYLFNIRQATTKLGNPTMDEFENIARMLNSFIFFNHAKQEDFKSIGDKHKDIHLYHVIGGDND